MPEQMTRQKRLVVPKDLKGPIGLESQPVSKVQWVQREQVRANLWNPNRVAPPELRLLKISLLCDGWTQPLVVRSVWSDGPGPVLPDAAGGAALIGKLDEYRKLDYYELVDGYHRWLVAEDPRIAKMTKGLVPVSLLDESKPLADLMMSTVRHNRARGDHQVDGMSSLTIAILEGGTDEDRVALLMQMESEEVRRLRDRGDMAKRGSGDAYHQGWKPGVKEE